MRSIILLLIAVVLIVNGCADVTFKDYHVQSSVKNTELAIREDKLDYAYSNFYYLKTYNTEESKRAYESLLDDYQYKLQIGGELWLLKRAKSVLNAGNYYTLEELNNALNKELSFYKTIATQQQYLEVLDGIEVAFIQHRTKNAKPAYLDDVSAKYSKPGVIHCDITVVSGLCPGESLDSLRKKIAPIVEMTNGDISRLLFGIDGKKVLVISYRGIIAAIIKQHKLATWLELATLKLKLERQGVRWKTLIDFPDDAIYQKSRTQAILSRDGFIHLTSWNRSIELEWSGPLGIKITHFHPALWSKIDKELVDNYWQELTTSSVPTATTILTDSTKSIAKEAESIQSVENPIIAVIHRHNTSILGNRQRISDLEIEEEFVECVQAAIEQVLPTAKYISADGLREALQIDDRRIDLIPALPDIRDINHPLDIDYLVIIDGMELKTESSVAAFCASGYGGGCLGATSELYPYRLAVTLIDPINWTVLKQIYATTASGHKGTIAIVIPVWWTFPPDNEVCSELGREVGNYLLSTHTKE